jgi:hypothetical protein
MSIFNTVNMKGFLRFQTVNKFSGKITQDTGWFPNTLLIAGKNQMAKSSTWMNFCQIGSSNAAPNENQTALQDWEAGTASVVATSTGQALVAPWYGYKRKTFRFAAGPSIAGKNLQEAGIGWSVSGVALPGDLISRALILDPVLQTPTVITPLADEFLDVQYELRYYAPINDVVGPQVTLDGVVYDTLTRAANATGSFWSSYIGDEMGVYADKDYWVAYSGDIQSVLLGPSGIPLLCDNSSQYNTAYSDNSYERQVNCPVGALGWNQDIRSIMISTRAGQFQTQFNEVATVDPAGKIPKNNNFQMLMNWTIGWSAL